jgi:hypothetical protein
VRSTTLPRTAPLRVAVGLRAIPYPLWLTLTFTIAAGVRLRPFIGTDWPLNDGGMFATAISEIARNGYALPATLDYNGQTIPFAYPPLAFYIAAVVSQLGQIAPVDVLRVLPFLFSCLSVAAFYRLARRLLSDDRAVIAATLGFGLVPSGWIWMVMGGGLTRGLGLALCLLALANIAAVLETPTRRGIVVSGVLAGLTLLTHIEFAWALAFSAAVFWIAAPSRVRLRRLVACAAIGLAVAAPWLAVVLLRDGLAPFVAASQTGQLIDPFEQLAALRQSGEPNFPIFLALALLGAIVTVVFGSRLLVLWVFAVALLDPRSWGTLSAAPLALLAARGAFEGIGPIVAGHRRLAVALGLATVAYLAHGALISNTALLSALTPAERDAMAWVASHTPSDARFAVLSERGWADDRQAEWFPVLAERVSLSTAQGAEWLPLGTFRERLRSIQTLEQCGSSDGACLDAWAADHGLAYDYVFLPKYRAGVRLDGNDTWCCMGLRSALRADPRFVLVYDGPGATIFEHSKR